MSTWLEDELFGPEDDDESELAKTLTFEATDIFAEPPDVSSEFARCHSPEYADQLNRTWMSHGMEPDSGPRESGDAAYEHMSPAFRKLIEAKGLGKDALRALAHDAVLEEMEK